MVIRNIYLNNGTLFATGFERVVHGGRGDYVEFTGSQIVQPLYQKFNGIPFNELNVDKTPKFYYYWLLPQSDKFTKVYYQLATVSYADYKVGYYYVSPTFLKDFNEQNPLF